MTLCSYILSSSTRCAQRDDDNVHSRGLLDGIVMSQNIFKCNERELKMGLLGGYTKQHSEMLKLEDDTEWLSSYR